jgi:hypothetical protein
VGRFGHHLVTSPTDFVCCFLLGCSLAFALADDDSDCPLDLAFVSAVAEIAEGVDAWDCKTAALAAHTDPADQVVPSFSFGSFVDVADWDNFESADVDADADVAELVDLDMVEVAVVVAAAFDLMGVDLG